MVHPSERQPRNQPRSPPTHGRTRETARQDWPGENLSCVRPHAGSVTAMQLQSSGKWELLGEGLLALRLGLLPAAERVDVDVGPAGVGAVALPGGVLVELLAAAETGAECHPRDYRSSDGTGQGISEPSRPPDSSPPSPCAARSRARAGRTRSG